MDDMFADYGKNDDQFKLLAGDYQADVTFENREAMLEDENEKLKQETAKLETNRTEAEKRLTQKAN